MLLERGGRDGIEVIQARRDGVGREARRPGHDVMLDLIQVLDVTVEVGGEHAPLSVAHTNQKHAMMIGEIRISDIEVDDDLVIRNVQRRRRCHPHLSSRALRRELGVAVRGRSRDRCKRAAGAGGAWRDW